MNDIKLDQWLDGIRKACRMLNSSPWGRIERKYIFMVFDARPDCVSHREFARLVNGEERLGWRMNAIAPRSIFGEWRLCIEVMPVRGVEADHFADIAVAFVEASFGRTHA